MRNTTQLLVTCFSFLIIFSGCSKQMVSPTREAAIPQTSNATTESVTFNDITIDPLQTHTFYIPSVTAAIISSGSVSVYAATNSTAALQWQSLPTIYGCDLHYEVVVGQATIQNNLGKSVTMSYRFDVTGN